jgi:hypothetical protein
VFSIVGDEMEGIADNASVSVQAHMAASQIPELGESDIVELTIDRLISGSDGTPEGG